VTDNNPITAIHHIAVAVKDIQIATQEYIDVFGYEKESELVLESNQKVYVQFMIKGELRVELLQPSSEDSPITNFIKKGGVLYHFCYETNDLVRAIDHIKKKYRAILTYGPAISLSMENCEYAFLAKPTGEVIELVSFNGGES
jgi:methylmalonyl-CoA/ethylmalonyl-CoA epimerase